MAHLHLPAEHDRDDRDMAEALAGALNSSELYVTWSSRSGIARPVVPAAAPARACEPRRRRRGIAGLLGALTRRRIL